MKRFTFLTLFLLLSAVMVQAQMHNGDFETWTFTASPDGWWFSNISGMAQPMTKTTDAQHGKIAIKGEVVSFRNVPVQPVLATFSSDSANGFPVSKRYASVTGYYKFTPVQDDSMLVFVAMYKNGEVIGGGAVKPNPAGSYTKFTANIEYKTSDIPDVCHIFISVFNHAGEYDVHPGSVMYIDNLSFN